MNPEETFKHRFVLADLSFNESSVTGDLGNYSKNPPGFI